MPPAAPSTTSQAAALPPRCWQTGRYTLTLDRVRVMGIVNVTPDSFSDGGRSADAAAAIARCEALVRAGADILDIGGESTRPGAAEVPADEELRRVLPVARAALTLGVPVSVDTAKPAVMRAVLDAGVDLINDVRALTAPGALEALAAHPAAGVCLMHMKGTPSTMNALAQYGDLVAEVRDFLALRVRAAAAAGIDTVRIAVDPGYGFAKQAEHSLELLARQRELLALGRPLVAGLSRKSSLGRVTGRPVDERLAASLAAALLAAQHGADVLRVHDVAETIDALEVWQAVCGYAHH